MGQFLKVRSAFVDPEEKNIILNSKEFMENEDTLCSSVNYFVGATTFNFNFSYQLSVGISRLQGLTNSLRVSFLSFHDNLSKIRTLPI